MTNYNILNLAQPTKYQDIQYQFRAEYDEAQDKTLIYRRFSSFGECKVSLSLYSKCVVTLFREVIAPPCYWITYKAISSFYIETSRHVREYNALADQSIAPWFRENVSDIKNDAEGFGAFLARCDI